MCGFTQHMHHMPESSDEVEMNVDLGIYRDDVENDFNIRQINPNLAAGRKMQQKIIIRTYFN